LARLGPEVEVDFSAATDLDSAALALMLQWQRESLQTHQKLRFTGVPANLNVLISLYGLSVFLNPSPDLNV